MSMVAAGGLAQREPGLWRRAAAWLVLLGPFFFLSYGAANWLASQRSEVGAIAFAWEHALPFWPWTIIPYWSIDVFYAISLFICTSRAEIDTHAKRLLTAQILAVACFILFPLTFSFPRPQSDGFAGFMFDALMSFDKPFNQAPSLHIALLIILWPLYARHIPARWGWALHVWFALILISVLTTYQHHFIDIPTGAWLGFFCLWLWPDEGRSPLTSTALANDRSRVTIAAFYASASALLALIGYWSAPSGLWLLWPAASLALVAYIYGALGPDGFQKLADGRMSLGTRWLLAPYLLGAWINSRLWTRHAPHPAAIADGVTLGRFPTASDARMYRTIIDLCAELPSPTPSRAVPLLDLATPDPARLREAASLIETARSAGPVLVCCALGYSRSAAAVAVWLLTTRRAATLDLAVAQIRQARPRIVLRPGTVSAIAAAARIA
jgi:protein-tyrosine phosphatase